MQTYQAEFLKLALTHQALQFGDFRLKSGRNSPYFFNMAVFNTGQMLSKLGYYYATTIAQSQLDFDVLFGPAYKGIPLACATAMTLATEFKRDIPYCFNRKEAKQHGEQGHIVGAPLSGKVLIIDDVITAGTAVQEAMHFIKTANAQPAGIIIALDRQEQGQGSQSTVKQLSTELKIPIISMITFNDIIHYLKQEKFSTHLIQQMEHHQATT